MSKLKKIKKNLFFNSLYAFYTMLEIIVASDVKSTLFSIKYLMNINEITKCTFYIHTIMEIKDYMIPLFME